MNKLINIRDEVNGLLRSSCQKWEDLKVIDVRWSIGLDDDEIYQVWIDEAAPNETELMNYLYKNCSFNDVEFFTEW